MFFVWGLKRGSGDFFIFKTEADAWEYFKTRTLVHAFSVNAAVVQYEGENAWCITSLDQFSPEGYYTIHWCGDKEPIEHHIKPCTFGLPA